MSGIEYEDKLALIKKYGKYLIILIILVIIFLFLKNYKKTNYSTIEKKAIEEALKYVNENNLIVNDEVYIELTLLNDIPGTELCSKASGVIISRKNNSLAAIPYLECNEFKSSIVKNKSKYIELNGDATILLTKGEVYQEPGYVLKQDVTVEIDGYVGTDKGIYTIKYNVYKDKKLKESLTRKVIVSENDKTKYISGLESVNAPTIILAGEENMVLIKGEKFEDPGAYAIDYVDGKISRRIKKIGEVNTSVPGNYVIFYSVTNTQEITTTKKRNVMVVEKKSNMQINLSKDESDVSVGVVLKLSIDDPYNEYIYTVLPDNTSTLSKNISYIVTSNRTYQFAVYDKYDNKYLKNITIDNIDNNPPTGSCNAVITSSSTSITVNAKDDIGIGGYSYIINGKSSDYITNNTYESSIIASTVSVKVKDLANNENTIKCSTEKKSNITINTTGSSPDVKVTIKTCFGNKTIRENVPLEEYLMGVLYGEENPEVTDNVAYIKAFILFARTYTLNRGGYWKNGTVTIKSCSSDQNWCDFENGCYRDQTQEMFDQCIDYAVNFKRNDYTVNTCANRVTTFPGRANISNKTFIVSNPNWWGDKTVTSTAVRSSWFGPASDKRIEFYKKLIEETAGQILVDSNGKAINLGYHGGGCTQTTSENSMCTNKAKELGNQGYTMEQIIEAYTKNYSNVSIQNFK